MWLQKLKFANLILVNIWFWLVSSFSLKTFFFRSSFQSASFHLLLFPLIFFSPFCLPCIRMGKCRQYPESSWLLPILYFFLPVSFPKQWFFCHLADSQVSNQDLILPFCNVFPKYFLITLLLIVPFLAKCLWCQEENKISEAIVSVLTWKVLFAGLRSGKDFFFCF